MYRKKPCQKHGKTEAMLTKTKPESLTHNLCK
nr:MAG TPA: hypothetical protein [Caudoviricetes sp.]